MVAQNIDPLYQGLKYLKKSNILEKYFFKLITNGRFKKKINYVIILNRRFLKIFSLKIKKIKKNVGLENNDFS